MDIDSGRQGKPDCWRMGFHLMPPTGWLNDPNGLCYFQGKYHVFFQYSPDSPLGALKYWGHYIGNSLTDWEFKGIALSPGEIFDKNGVYSGSTLVKDHEMYIYYTGNVKLVGDFNYITDGRQGNTVLVKTEDGIHFSEKQLLLTNQDYPSGLTCHVRDPKVWMEKDGQEERYYMVLGARKQEDIGEVLIYESMNLTEWKLAAEVTSEKPFGFMWECPDIFEIDHKKVLSISPQGVDADGWEYRNTYQSGYYLYSGDLKRDYCLGEFKEWDRGFDFYAPQTFEDAEGRRILIGWMGMPDTPEHYNPTIESGWQHALTIPRRLMVRDNKMLQVPVEELENLRMEFAELEVGTCSEKMQMYEVCIDNSEDQSFQIEIEKELYLKYKKEEGLFTMSFVSGPDQIGRGRKERGVTLEQCRKVQIYVDTSSVEVFINEGEEVFSTRFYPESGKSRIAVTEGVCKAGLYQLKDMKVMNFK